LRQILEKSGDIAAAFMAYKSSQDHDPRKPVALELLRQFDAKNIRELT